MIKIKSKIVAILGPTSSGKSALGIILAKKFKGEIISSDSRQVYRGMNIGTGKVTRKEQRMVNHHLIDIANPKKVFTVSDFKKHGTKEINKILNSGKTPFIVGGTGFYMDALIKDLELPEVAPNKKLRKRFDKLSVENLFKMLRKLDPSRARTIDKNNKRRLIRALEIIYATNKPVPELNSNSNYQVLWLGLNPKDLDKKIESRLDSRLKHGMIAEVKKLLKEGVSKKRLFDLGLEYRWVSKYLAGEISRKEMRDQLLSDIIKYSKRQMTWFKRNKDINWVRTKKDAEKLTRKFLFSRH